LLAAPAADCAAVLAEAAAEFAAAFAAPAADAAELLAAWEAAWEAALAAACAAASAAAFAACAAAWAACAACAALAAVSAIWAAFAAPCIWAEAVPARNSDAMTSAIGRGLKEFTRMPISEAVFRPAGRHLVARHGASFSLWAHAAQLNQSRICVERPMLANGRASERARIQRDVRMRVILREQIGPKPPAAA